MLESDVLLDGLEIFKSTNSIFFIKSSHSFLPFISSNTSRFCSSNLSLRSRLRESDAEIRRRSPKFVSVSLSVNRGDGFGSDSTRELGKNGENSGEEESVVYEDVRERKGRRSSAINTTKHLWAGAVAAMVSRTLVAPLERLKLEYIVRGEQKHIFELIQTIATTQGIKGFWKGNFVNILRTAPFKAINFYAYDTYRNYLCNLSGNEEATNFERFVAGAAAGITATLLCLPMDTVKW